VQSQGQPRFWLLLKQEEQRSRHLGGSRTIGKWVTEIYYHFDLQSHDPATADWLWKKRMLTVKEEGGGRVAQARLLGQENEVVWLFLNDGPVAISSRDGSRLADRATIEQIRERAEQSSTIPAFVSWLRRQANVSEVNYDANLLLTTHPAHQTVRFSVDGHGHRFLLFRSGGGRMILAGDQPLK